MTTWLLKKIIYLLIVFIASIIGLKKYKSIIAPYRYLSVILAATFLFELVALICAYTIKSNEFVYSIFDYFETTGFLLVFELLYTKKIFKYISFLFIVIFISIKILSEFVNITSSSTDILTTIKSMLLIISSLLLFLNWFLNPKEENLLNQPSFWFATTILFFYSINLLFWSTYSSKFFNIKSVQLLFIEILYYSNIILYCILGYVLYIASLKR